MQLRKHGSKHNKTLGVESVRIEIQMGDFANEIIGSTAVKDAAQLGCVNTLDI